MKHVGCALILLFVPVLSLSGWVTFPISPPLAGMSFGILRYNHAGAGATLFSYGAAAAVALVLAAEGCRRASALMACGAATTLILVAFASTLQVAFADPGLLKDLANEAGAAKMAFRFSQHELPINAMEEPDSLRLLPLETAAERLAAGWYFMRLGWYLTLLAAAAITLAALRHLDRRERRMLGLVTSLGLIALGTIFLLGPLLAERALVSAYCADARGAPNEAIAAYHRAIQFDGWNALNLEIYQRIGSIEASLDRNGTTPSGIYRAEYLVGQGQIPEAVAGYERLATADVRLRALMRTRVAELWTDYGLALYQTGAFGAAAEAWQSALAHEPSDWLAAFYLSRGYFALGCYSDAIEIARKLSDRADDPVFRANLYANLGDAYTRQAEFANAHLAYERSYYWDYVFNRRALFALIGF